MNRMVQPRSGISREAALIAFLALVCAGILLACVHSSLQWIGKPFPGFLLMNNRVVPAAGMPHWTGLQAGKIFMCELVAVDGHPAGSATQLRDQVAGVPPGTPLAYTFRRGGETLKLAIPVMLFTGKDFLLLFVFYFMNGAAFMVVGFVVRTVRPNNPASLGMFLVGLCAGLFAITACDLYGPYRFFRIHVFMECFMPAAIVHLAMVFPEMSRRVRRRPALLALPYLAALALAAHYEVFLYHPGRYVLSHNLATVYLAFALAYMLVMIAVRYVKTQSMLTKQRIRVLFLGYFTGLAVPALIILAATYTQQSFSFTLISFFTILWPISVGYAILKHNFFDIDVVVKRSLYYVSLTCTILAAYLAVLFVLDRFFHTYAFSQSRYFPLLFCLVILLLFNPLRQRMQRIIDRVFFRIRYDYRETVEGVSKAMTSLLNVRDIADTLLRTLTETMAVSRGIVALKSGAGGEPLIYTAGEEPPTRDRGPAVRLFQGLRQHPSLTTVYDFEGRQAPLDARASLAPLLSALGILLAVPVTFKSEMIGFLGLGGKKSGKPFSRSDLDLLETLANQSSVALSNALSYSELQELNQNLEGLVEKRTAELAESNKKLESSNEKLKELDKLKSQFFSNVGHELRTPLTLSLAPLESILQGETGELEDDRKTLLSTIHRNALKLLKLVNNLLDFSKIEAGRLRLNLGSHPFLPFFRQVAEPFQLAAPTRGLTVTLDETGVQDPALSLTMDRERMEKVFANLLSNAFKYTPRGGVITLAVTESEQEIRASVSDTGPGIPAEDLPRIFERFYQARARDAVRLPGTGIGLSLVKEFTELHGGTVAVESAVGRGTRFTVTLRKGREHFPEDLLREAEAAGGDAEGIVSDTGAPSHALYLDAEAAGPGEAEALPGEGTAPADAPCVLVVEDNHEMRRFIRVLLQKRYRVLEAADGREGLEMCRERRPDLVLSDVTMPRMSGIELCRAVKQDGELRFIPFVLLTSHAEVQYRIEGFESGADDYLGKPFNVRELQARIRSLLTLRAAERELQHAHGELRRAHGELQQAESQLVHAEKMASLGRLVAGVAHELNNPISFVYGNMNVLQEYVEAIRGVLEAYRALALQERDRQDMEQRWRDGDMDFILEDLRGLIDGCREGALRTKQIVRDLRTFSRLDEAERKFVDIHQSLRSTLALLSDRIGGRIRVHEVFQELPEVDCYAGQINQVFMNLLANAAQAMEDGGDLWIRTRFLEPDRVEVQIEDTGCGMSPDVMEKIFDPFFTTKPVGTGTGLGLSITYGIVQRHGGSIAVKSEPGQGTCFTLLLPRTLPDENKGDADVQAAA